MKRFLILILFTLNTLAASQNPYKIYGVIKDSKKQSPLIGANIFLENTSLGSATDKDGKFSFSTDSFSGKYTLVASYVGYHDFRREIELPLQKDLQIDISLKESAIMMDQIVVTGTRSEHMLKHSPVTTQVINGKTIQESGAVDLAEALERVTGVDVSSNQLGTGTSTVELQGFGSERVLILVDGVKMIGRIRGDLDISEIPSSQIERIEIVKGATSTLYGSEAMGGVINIITRKPGDKFKFNADTQAGSYGKLNSNITVSGDWNGWQPIVGFNYRRSSGFDLNKKTVAMDGPAYNKYQGRLKLIKKFDDNNSFATQLNYFDEKQSVISSEIFEDIISNSNFAGRTEFKTNFLKPVGLTAGVEYSAYDHTLDQKVRSSGYIKKGSLTNENLFKSDLLFNFDLPSDILSQKINGGYAFENESIESDRLTGSNSKSNTLHNFFLQDEVKVSQMFTFVLGGRVDMHSAYGTELSPKLSVMLSPAYNLRFRASYGHGFRAPSFKELYLKYFNESVLYRVDGNPDLRPETSNSFNLGTEFWTDNDYHTRINFFYNNISNLIDYKLIGGLDTLTYKSENLNAAKTWGAEWDMEYYPFDWLEMALGYYYLNSETKYTNTKNQTTTTGLQLKPMHKANIRLGFKLLEQVKMDLSTQFIGKEFYFDPDLNSFHKNWIKGYSLVHLNLSFPIMNHLGGQAGIKNLTNYANRNWGPMPGREFYATLHIDF